MKRGRKGPYRLLLNTAEGRVFLPTTVTRVAVDQVSEASRTHAHEPWAIRTLAGAEELKRIQAEIDQIRKAREKEKKNQRPKSRSRSDLER